MNKNLLDSLAQAEHEPDLATAENIAEKAKKADIWREKKINSELNNI
ncbi:hypothetical protein [Pedobacter sp. KLB.chiD]